MKSWTTVIEVRRKQVEEANRRFRTRHPDRVRASNRKNYEVHKIRERARQRENYRKDPETHKTRVKNWQKHNSAGHLWQSIRRRKDVDPELTLEDIEEILAPMVCSVTGTQLIWDVDKPYDPLKPSIDRIDSDKGYTRSNLRLTSLVYNIAKSQYSDEQVLEYLVRPLVRKLGVNLWPSTRGADE